MDTIINCAFYRFALCKRVHICTCECRLLLIKCGIKMISVDPVLRRLRPRSYANRRIKWKSLTIYPVDLDGRILIEKSLKNLARPPLDNFNAFRRNYDAWCNPKFPITTHMTNILVDSSLLTVRTRFLLILCVLFLMTFWNCTFLINVIFHVYLIVCTYV